MFPISRHRIEFNHDFNWDTVKILDKEPNYTKRLTSEMLHIKKQKMGLNIHNDTEHLENVYMPIFDSFPNI